MGKVIFREDDGTEVVLRTNIADEFDVLFRSDYIATKLWSRDDIRYCLQEKGYDGNDSEIDAVLNTGFCKSLNDCTDEDWDTIYVAIWYARQKGDIQK